MEGVGRLKGQAVGVPLKEEVSPAAGVMGTGRLAGQKIEVPKVSVEEKPSWLPTQIKEIKEIPKLFGEGLNELMDIVKDPYKSTLIKETILGILPAAYETLPFIKTTTEYVKSLVTGAPTEEKLTKAEDLMKEVVRFPQEFAWWLFGQPTLSAYSLITKKPIEEQFYKLPAFSWSAEEGFEYEPVEMPTIEAQAYGMLLEGVSPVEVGITLGAQEALRAGILGAGALRTIRTIKPTVTQKTVNIKLTRQDLKDIMRDVAPPKKVKMFKTAVEQGIKIGAELKKHKGRQISVKIKTPRQEGDFLYQLFEKEFAGKKTTGIKRTVYTKPKPPPEKVVTPIIPPKAEIVPKVPPVKPMIIPPKVEVPKPPPTIVPKPLEAIKEAIPAEKPIIAPPKMEIPRVKPIPKEVAPGLPEIGTILIKDNKKFEILEIWYGEKGVPSAELRNLTDRKTLTVNLDKFFGEIWKKPIEVKVVRPVEKEEIKPEVKVVKPKAPPKPELDIEQVKNIYKTGKYTPKQIAESFGVEEAKIKEILPKQEIVGMKQGQRIEEVFSGVPLYKIADFPVVIKGTKLRLIDAIGSEIRRYYGLSNETRRAIIKLKGENELRKEDIKKLFMKEFPITVEEGKLLTYHQEQPLKYPIPKKLEPYARKVNIMLEVSKKEIAKRKLLKDFFPQSFINRANKEILQHQEAMAAIGEAKPVKIPKYPALEKAHKARMESLTRHHQEAISNIQEYINFLKELRYVPHLYLPEETIQRTFLKLMPEGRITAAFRSTLSKIKGRKIDTLDKAKELGLFSEEDIRVLLGTHFEYVFRKLAIYDTVEFFKKNKQVVLPDKIAPPEWEKVAITQLDGYRVHPLMVRAIEDFAISSKSGFLWRGYDAVNYTGKALVFYNPIILPFWDVFQGVAVGSISPLHPFYTRNLLIQAWKDCTQRTELYKEAVKGGLYTTPETVRMRFSPPIEEQMKLLVNQMDVKYPKWKSGLERAMNRKIDWTTFTTKLIYPTLYQQNWRLTWFTDRVLRTASLRHGLNRGMSLPDAIDFANTFHADYNLFARRAKLWFNRVFLVPTYKANMLFNAPGYIAKNTYRMFKKVFARKLGTITPIEKESFKSIFRIAGLIATILGVAYWRGYKLQEDYRLVKKLEEPHITKEGKIQTERVITLPGPFFEWPKLIGRIKQMRGLEAIYMYLAKVPGIIWGLQRNRRWNGETYWDEGAAPEIQRKQIITNIIRDYIAPVDRAMMMSDTENEAIDNILSQFGLATYKRGGTEQRILWQIIEEKGKLNRYLKRLDVPWEDKEKAIEAFEEKVEKLIKELEEYSMK